MEKDSQRDKNQKPTDLLQCSYEMVHLGAVNISIFSPTTSFGRFGGGEGFRSRRFQIETLYRKKGLIKKSQPVKSERCLC